MRACEFCGEPLPPHCQPRARFCTQRCANRGAENTFDTIKASLLVQENGCWIWPRCKNKDGYGHVSFHGRVHRVHCLLYRQIVGPVPAGKELDHLCRNHACANPDHLEPVDHRKNVLRGNSPTAQHARQTHCLRGHLFNNDNTVFSRGRRQCRICRRQREKNRRR